MNQERICSCSGCRGGKRARKVEGREKKGKTHSPGAQQEKMPRLTRGWHRGQRHLLPMRIPGVHCCVHVCVHVRV